MEEKGIYFAKNEFYRLIKAIGGIWNDSKERPIVCLIKSKEHDSLYWAIPMGNWSHRDEKAKKRIEKYLNKEDSNIESCYYHLGKTTTKSIFFISDVIPIIDDFIEREYAGYNSELYVIKNKKLIAELERKLKRILAYEKANKNYFRQHITDIKNFLINAMNNEEEKIAFTSLADNE
ncbi:hypothetical protein [Clostridioides sp. ZZV14-6048]|uniref:hypothetical protein n=1 Tax=Clostridioides sp. ZZV14-6048 TaxID=2811490 RepID=UPI001D0FD3C1|nr:hypothetical protein [Clostridioides sp. ZZV14-6048]